MYAHENRFIENKAMTLDILTEFRNENLAGRLFVYENIRELKQKKTKNTEPATSASLNKVVYCAFQ